MDTSMKDKDNILPFPLKIIERNEPHELIDYHFSQLEEAMLYYDMECPEIEQAYLSLLSSILWWNQFWED